MSTTTTSISHPRAGTKATVDRSGYAVTTNTEIEGRHALRSACGDLSLWLELLSGSRRSGGRASEDSVDADDHPNHVDEGRRVGAIPAAVEDETGAREDVQPLIEPRSPADSAHREHQVGRQHQGRSEPSDDLNGISQHRSPSSTKRTSALSNRARHRPPTASAHRRRSDADFRGPLRGGARPLRGYRLTRAA